MPEATLLHIQARDSGAARVMELPGVAVRIGRGAECEVRLGEPALAEVQCLLRRRGGSWHVQPVGPPGRVSIGGRAVEHQRPLPMGVPLRVGDTWLTLRPAEPTVPSWGRHDPPGHGASVNAPAADAAQDLERDRLRRWEARLGRRERWLRDRLDRRREGLRRRAGGAAEVPTTAGPVEASNEPEDVSDQVPVEHETEPPPIAELAATTAIGPSFEEVEDVLAGAGDPLPAPGPAEVDVEARAEVEPPPRPAGPVPLLEIEWAITPGPVVAEPAAEPTGVSEPEISDPSTEPAPTERAESVFPPLPVGEGRGEGPPPDSPGDGPSPRPRGRGGEGDSLVARVFGWLRPGPPAPVAEPRPTVADAPEGLPEPGRVQDSTSNPRPEELPREVEVAPEPAGIVEPIEPIASEPVVADGPRERAEWPSAKAIFAAQAPRPNPGPVKVKARAKAARDIVPTAGVAPRGWKVPGFRWIGPPLIAAALVSGAGGTWLAWAWARDEQAAGAVVDRLLVDRRPLAPEDAAAMVEAAPTGTSWWRSTAGHLLLRAVVAERSGDAEGGRALLDAARGAAPLEPGVRFALAHLDEGSPAGALGLSRDVAPLAWTGRRLLDAGKLEAGLRAYRAALDLAAGAEPARLPYPAFLDDPRTRRYALPREALIGPVVRDLAGRDDWPFERWSAALPDSAVVALAAGRALLERDSPDAPKVLEQALAAPEPAEGRARAEHLAATAEALALLGRWDEAERGYREAIAAGVDDRDRRAWQFNLAEVRGRLGDDAGRDEARAAAKGNDPNDEIARRAARAQHEAGGGRDREPLRR